MREAFEAKVVLPTSSGAQVSANYPTDLGEFSYGSRRIILWISAVFLHAQTTGKNLPEVVAKIILAKQAEEKVRETTFLIWQLDPTFLTRDPTFLIWQVRDMSEAADALLSDLHGRDDFGAAAAELSLYLADSKKELYDRWCDEVRLALYGNHLPHMASTCLIWQVGMLLDEPGMALQLTGKIMEVSKENEGNLRVNFSDRLVTFLREARR